MTLVRRTLVSSLVTGACMLTPALAAAAPFAYVPNWSDGTVSVIDLATNAVTNTLPVEESPRDVVISSDGARSYVANFEGSTGGHIQGSISVIDTASQSVVDTWPACAPAALALNVNDSVLYYSSDCWTRDDDRSFVRAVDTTDGSSIATIEIGPKDWYLHNMALSLDGSTLYLAVLNRNVIKIDTATHTSTGAVVTADSTPGYVELHPDGTRLYVGNRTAGTLSVFDTATDQSLLEINVGNSPGGIDINSDGSLLYVANSADNTVSAINATTNTVIATIPVGSYPTGVAFSPRGDRAYVPCRGANLVSVIDTTSSAVINNVLVGTHPIAASHFVTPAAAIYVDPSHHDFGDVSVGQTSATQNIMVHNEGSAVLNLGTIQLLHDADSEFSIDTDLCSTNTLATNGSCGVVVSFSPTSFGDKTADLAIPSDDTSTGWLYVSLLGRARAPQLHIVGMIHPMPANPVVLFGASPLDATIGLSKAIMNEGNETLSIGTIGGVDDLAAPFTIGNDNCSGMDLAPGSACEIALAYSPTVDGTHTDNFDLPSNDPTHPSLTVGVSGWGTPDPVGNIVFYDTVDPALDALVPMGDVAAGATVTAGVFLFNNGNASALSVSAIRITGADADQFAFDPTAAAAEACGAVPITVPGPINLAMPPQLQPKPCEVTVTFAPTSAGDKTATLEVDSTDPDEATITVELSGRALAPMIQVVDSLAYGPVPLQTPVLRQVTIENGGTTDLTISNIAIAGDSDFVLELDSGTSPCGDTTRVIGPAHTCGFAIVFTPASEASITASITITSDDPNLASASIAVTGEGYQPAVDPDPDPDLSGDPDEDGGCSCSGSASTTGAGLALLLIGWLSRRRRR